ncbi:MAG TPA: TA system VapC family ribonuclease toxin [Vicinamibacterales bacterium]|nr:TA system VapC family ribonuclease toxin [Vicinamibacterales bacterium]
MNRPALLDASVLIALFDGAHIHHHLAHDWFAENRHRGWATAPLTENALVRIVSNPGYGQNAERVSTLVTRLRAFCAATDHRFWPDSLSLRDDTIFNLAVISPRHLTDVYLVALAKVRDGVLVTFDRTIPVKAVLGASRDLLEVIGA